MIATWASNEMRTADLGDERLDRRVELLLSRLGTRPNLSIPAACMGKAEMKAAYAFFDNEKVTFDKVLAPHIECTRVRMAQHKVVLLVQDTTENDGKRPEKPIVGMGLLDDSRPGFLLHEMQAFTPEGTPLGTAWAEIINRTEGICHAPRGEKELKRKQTPFAEKESVRWLTALQKARDVAQELPDTCCICMGDSEADIYELFVEPRGDRPVHWLIQACQGDQSGYWSETKGDVSVPGCWPRPNSMKPNSRYGAERRMSCDREAGQTSDSRETRQASVERSSRQSRNATSSVPSCRREACSGPSKCGSGSGTKPTRRRGTHRMDAYYHATDRHAGANSTDC